MNESTSVPDGLVVVDLGSTPPTGASGAVWGMALGQLNANLVTLNAGETIPAHVNNEVDVLMIVRSGAGRLVVDEIEFPIRADHLSSIPRGSQRSIQADEQLLYYSVHLQREGLTIRPRATPT